jgi:hypothetical protein
MPPTIEAEASDDDSDELDEQAARVVVTRARLPITAATRAVRDI